VQVLVYWLARTALMLCVFFALWGLGWQPWFAVVAAAVIAWLISYALFGAMRDAAAKQMERWASRRFAGARGDEIAEDAESGSAG
jgi:divalent metal cation (Fe/Co/Zn/Cd) transporter